MPGTSAVGGLVSGLDTKSLVEQLVAVSRKRVDIVVNNQTLQSDKLTAFQSLNTQLSSFQEKSKTATLLMSLKPLHLQTQQVLQPTHSLQFQRHQMRARAHILYHLRPPHN